MDCRRGDLALKKEAEGECAMQDFPCLNVCEDTSAILLSSLAMNIGVSEDDSVWRIRIFSMRRRRATRINLLMRSLYVYCTPDVVSQKSPLVQMLGTV